MPRMASVPPPQRPRDPQRTPAGTPQTPADHDRRLFSSLTFSGRPLRYFCRLWNASNKSIGTGKMIVEFFSAEISVNVCR